MFIEFLFFITIGIAFVDMVLLIQISTGIGIYFIVVSQILTGAYGLYRLRKLDFSLYFFLDAELKKGERIVRELWEEVWILTAACFLILPGVISDVVGSLFLIPPIRRFFLDYISELN